MIPVRTRRLLLWVALPALLLVLLYTVLGFFVVPRLIRSGADDFVSKNYHRKVALGDIRFNPYSLRLDVRDFALPDSDGQPMLSFSHLVVDLTVASIWRRGPDFEAIVLEQPFARVLIKRDGTLNFSELALPPSPEAKPEPKPKPARLFINHFSVQGGNVAFEDLAHPSAFRTEIKPITFDLRNFTTVGKGGGTYALSGASDAGETFRWSGSLSANPVASHGQFEVGNLQAQTIWKYVRDSVQFELPSGTLSLAGDYDFTTGTTPTGLGVNVHEVTVADLGIRPKGAKEDYIKLSRLEVHDTRADVAKRTVDVGSVRLAGGEVRAWLPGAGGAKANLMELVGATGAPSTAPTTTSAAASADRAAAPAQTPSAPATDATSAASPAYRPEGTGTSTPAAWVVSVPDIALDNLKIAAEDRQVSPAVPVHLDDLNIHVTGFATSRTAPVAVTVATKVNGEGTLEAKADLSPDFNAVKAEVELAKIDLTVLQPYIAQRTAMTLRAGQLSTKLNAQRAADGNVAVSGEIDLAKLRTVDNELKRDFIKFDRLQIAGIDYQATLSDAPNKPKPSLHVRSIVARAPYARVIIESDRTVNVARVLSGPRGLAPASADTARAAGAAPAPGGALDVASTPDSPEAHAAISVGGGAIVSPTPATPAASPAAATGTAASAGPPQSKSKSKSKTQSKRGGRQAPGAAPPTEGPMSIAIDDISIQEGSANYADLWIQPHFAVGIQTLNGYIRGLSSNPRAHAKVELNGKVDRYAPVRIWGETNPLAATAFTDIRMSFKGVELTSATPYSGRFAGYKIEKGKLSVDIEYKIENRQLNAAHKFVIDQLELGEKVESPDAVKLPLKIAIALLKDRNGVIDLDLPVTGSLDDPKFRLGPIIWKAVLNLLTKIATAPFALLGHLFGGGEQMNFIDFRPGSAVLEAAQRDKLVALVKALKEKEKLELDVPITFAPDLDRPALAAAHLNSRLLAIGAEHSGGSKRGKAPAKAPVPPGTQANGLSELIDAPPPSDPALTDPEQRYHRLVALHREELGKSAPLPESARLIEEAGKKKDQQPDFGGANAALEAALLQKMPVPDNDLETLGKHRARAIQDVLLVGTDIDPARVFVIGTAPKAPGDKDTVRVELALK